MNIGPGLSTYGLAADLVLAIHLLFVAFAVLGGVLVPLWPPLAWIHAPIALWAGVIMLADWTCPLTPLEKGLRQRAGQRAFSGGFVEHYLLRFAGGGPLTRARQHAIGAMVLVWNLLLYALIGWWMLTPA